ncbi:MAG: hypothetical protein K2V38_24030, partial [Gemmataceae bacterium]|nr:hypothetical protein [Gemmataceae bacterium]
MTALVLAFALTVTAPVPKDELAFQRRVDAAREKAIKYLRVAQDKDGGWEAEGLKSLADMEGGATALAVVGLLEAGVKPDDPAITKAVEYLLKLKPTRTYVVSLRARALAGADPRKYAKEIQADADWLLGKALRRNGKLAGWSYPGND